MKIEQILKFARDEFVYGGHIFALGATSVVLVSAILLDIKITLDFLVIVYLITYIVYLYNRLKEFKKDYLTNSDRTKHIRLYIKYVPFIVFSSTLIIIVILFYFGNFLSIVFGLSIFLLGILYSLFFKEITKKIVGFKNFYVALVWSLLVMFLAVYYSFSLNLSIFFIFIFIFFRCFISTSFYDIKDIESDKKDNLLTLAIVFGKEKLIKLLNVINVLTLIPIIFGVYLQLLPKFSLMFFFTIPITFYILKEIKNSKANIAYLSEVVVGIEKISWIILILLGNFLL